MDRRLLGIIGFSFVVIMASPIDVALAYSGSNNIVVGQVNNPCQWAAIGLGLNATSNYAVFDHNGVSGWYGWQVEVFTVQDKPAYQWISNVKSTKLTDFFVQYLLSNNGYDHGDISVAGTYYPGTANPAVKIDVIGNIGSSGYAIAAVWYVYVNGVLKEVDSVQFPSQYQAQPQTYQSVLVTDDSSNLEFVHGAGYFTYIDGPQQKTCGNTWGTSENSNMQYGNGFYKCWGSGGFCSQVYNAPSGSWQNQYFLNVSNSVPWNKLAIRDTGTKWLYGLRTINPDCPAYASVQFSGYESGDSYSRSLSLQFASGFGSDTLLNNAIVAGSFSYNFTIPQSYLNLNSGYSSQIKFQLTTYVGTWYITSTIHYYQLQSCVS